MNINLDTRDFTNVEILIDPANESGIFQIAVIGYEYDIDKIKPCFCCSCDMPFMGNPYLDGDRVFTKCPHCDFVNSIPLKSIQTLLKPQIIDAKKD